MKTFLEYIQKKQIKVNDNGTLAYYDSFDKIKENDWVIFQNTDGDTLITQIKSYEYNPTRNRFYWKFYYLISCFLDRKITVDYENGFSLTYWSMKKWDKNYEKLVYTFLNSINKDFISEIQNSYHSDMLTIGKVDKELRIQIYPPYQNVNVI